MDYGCLNYVDDLVLLCPRVKGLQRMAAICEKYGIMYNITYNAKKFSVWPLTEQKT